MTTTITPSTSFDTPSTGPITTGTGLAKILASTGKFPVVGLVIKPLSGASTTVSGSPNIQDALNAQGQPTTGFLTYSFKSSVIVPVDTFSFTYASPDAPPVTRSINEGDIAVLTGNGIPLCTGIIDQVEIETDAEGGEKITLSGRDLMSQLEDQDSISLDQAPIWTENVAILNGVRQLCINTRINTVVAQGSIPNPSPLPLLATEPGESKLASLQRFLEPYNLIAWMAPNGSMNVGKPSMGVPPSGTFIISRSQRLANCLSMRCVKASTTIPTTILPIWAAQEGSDLRAYPQQALPNRAYGPSRLMKLGHRVPKTIVISTPQGLSPQGLADINTFNQAGGGDILQAYAKREMARKNVGEIDVQVVVPGHFRDDGTPFMIDTTYRITYDRADLDEVMYLYGLEYTLDESGGQRTNLFFCRLGCIVADIVIPGGSNPGAGGA